MSTQQTQTHKQAHKHTNTQTEIYIIPTSPISARSPKPCEKMLPHDQFLKVLASTPLISIDLIPRDATAANEPNYANDTKILLGRRVNDPAKGTWFVPGGIVRKNEKLDHAFERILRAELGIDSIQTPTEADATDRVNGSAN